MKGGGRVDKKGKGEGGKGVDEEGEGKVGRGYLVCI